MWSYLNYTSDGWISAVATVLLIGSLLLVLLGRPRNWRTVIGAALFSLTFLTVLGMTLFGVLSARQSDMSPALLSKMQEAGPRCRKMTM